MEEQNLGFVAGIDHSGFDKDAKHIQDSVEQVAKKVEQSGLSVDEFAKRMQGLLASFDRLTQAVDKNTSAQEKAMGAGKKAADAEKQGADKATDAIDKTGKATDELGRKLKKTGDDGAEGFGKLQKAAAGFFTIAAAKEFGQKIFEVRSEIQSLQTSFDVLVGNKQQAEELFNSIKDFATHTPMQMKDLASAAQTMMSFNIPVEQIMENLKALGDVSMGDAQKFQSLSLAFSQMSATGKLMGQDLLQMINAGFNPLATISEKTGKSISELKDEMSKGAISADMVRQAFMDATSEGGKFAGMLEKQSQTLGGAYSNLQGAINDMFNAIGEQTEGIMAGSINAATVLVQNYEKVGKVILGLVSTYGTYKAAVMTVTAIQGLQTAGVGALTAAETVHYGWLVLCEKAQKLLNATMLNNPYVLVATLIAGVAAALWNMKSQQDLVNEAQDEYNRKKEETIAKEEEHKRKINELIGVASDESLSTESRKMAMSELMKKYPQLFADYNTEIAALKDIAYWKAKIAEIESGKSIQLAHNELLDVNRQINELEAKSKRIKQTTKNVYNHQTLQWEKQVINEPSLTREEQAKLQQLKNQRTKLNKQIKQDADDKYLKDLTGVSNDDLSKQIKERENLLARIKVAEQKNGGKRVDGKVQTGGVTGVYSKDEIQDQLNRLKWEQNRRTEIIKNGSQNFVSEAQKAYNKEKKELDRLRSLSDPNKRRSSNKTVDVGGRTVKESELTTEELQEVIEKQQKIVSDNQKKLESLSGKSLKSSASAAARAAKDAEQQAKERAMANAKETADKLKHQEEMDALDERLRRANEDASIAAIQSQAERERAEREREHRRTLEEIDKEEQEIFKKIYEQRKASYENTHKGERYENTDAGAAGYLDPKAREEMIKSFSDEEKKMYDDNKAYAVAKRKEQNAIFARLEADTLKEQAQSMRDYLKEYGTFQQQKLAITQEYAEKIAEAEKVGNKGEVLRLKAERDSQVAQANAKSLAMDIDWNQTFSGLGNVLEEIAKDTLDKVNQYMETADFKGLAADAKQAYQDLKKQLIDAGGQKASNPFSKGTWDEIGKLTTQYKTKVKALADASEKHAKDTEKYNKALDTEVKAQEKLAKAKEDQANHAGDEKYERAVEEANLDLADASAKAKNALEEWMDSGEEVKNQQQGVYDTQQKLGQATDSAEQGLNNFNTVVSQLTSGTLVDFADGIANIIMAITKTGDQMEGIGGLFGEAGKQIGGIVGAILSIIDMLGTDPAKFITDILDKISQVIEAIISNIPQIIGAIIQGIGNIIAGVFKGLGSLFGLDVGGKDNHEEMLKRQKEYTRSIESSSRALEKFTTELERSYGIVAMQNAKKGEEIIRKNMESIVNGIDSVLSDNYGGGHADYYHVNKQQDVLRGILNYGKAYGLKASNGTELAWQELLSLNSPEALAKTFKAISESGDDLWRKITTMGYNEGALEEWIDKLIDAYDQIDENNKQLMEQLTTTTADNVYDDFLNSLYDLADGSEDVTENIAEDWQKMVNRMVVNNIIGSKMRDELESWYKGLYDVQENYNKELSELQKAKEEGRITDYSYNISLDDLNKRYDASLQKQKDAYNDIVDTSKQQIEDFTEMGIIKPISEATDEVKKYFEDLRDSWASTLTDMTATTEDWKNELTDQVLSDLVESTILNAPLAVMVDGAEKQFDDFNKYLEDWTGRYKAIIEDQTLTDEERTARLKAMIQEQTDVREKQAAKSRSLAEGIGKDMKEAFSNSLDNLGDTLLDALLDTEKDAESMGREIASTLIKEMLQTMLASEKYSSEIAKIKEKWQQVLTGKNTDEEGNILFTMDDVLQQVSDLNDTIANDEAIKSLAGQYQELNKQIKNTDSLFGSIKDTFASSMMDMNKTADEMASDIGQTIAKNIIEQMVVSSAVKPLVDNLQKAFDAANVEGATYSSVIGDEAVQNALAELKKAFPELQETAKGIMTGLGVKMNETAKQGFSDLKGTFINTLTDMDADAETLGKNLGKSMMEQMLNAMVEKNYGAQMKKVNDEWADALEAGDPARLEAIKQKAEDLFATIEADQSIKKLADDIKSLTDSSTSPFDNLRSSFLSALTDMSKSTADFTKDISTMIAQSFVDSFVMGDLFDEKLAKWKKKYKEITTDSSLSEEQRMKQLKGLSELIAGENEAMKAEVRDIYKWLGIHDGQDQSATMNMAEAATYDQFQLYLGMETSHLMVAEETKGLVAQVLSTLQGMSSLTNPSQNYGEQIFMRLGTTNEYLLAVKKAAEGIRAEFALKLDLMNSHLSKL